MTEAQGEAVLSALAALSGQMDVLGVSLWIVIGSLAGVGLLVAWNGGRR